IASFLSAEPIARSQAGIYHGRYLPTFNQDVFLGIKYSPKPVRFTPSVLASDSPNSQFNATSYGTDCYGFGADTTRMVAEGLTTLGEDCLHLNIVKPAGESEGLPVLLWIYGGGWFTGATSDPRYNLSYVVEQSVLNGKPVMGVSINYRLAAFGFIFSEEVKASGNQNLGLRDQRIAMRWVNRHIASFGGDPNKVTIWGESAGAYSVGDHIAAYDGDSEGLFRAAILESGGGVGAPLNGTDWYQHVYNELSLKAGCSNATDTLQCLREVPYEVIAPLAYNGRDQWFHTIDGSLIPRFGQESLVTGKFVKIPILLGTNTDEGFGFNAVNNDTQAIGVLTHNQRFNINEAQAKRLLELYPNDPTVGYPYGWGNRTWPEKGLQYKRIWSIATDMTMFAPRRLFAEQMSKYVSHVYSYRWDAPKYNTTNDIGVNHFSEIPFVFGNPEQDFTPLGNSTENLRLARLVGRMWTSFAYDLDPNGHGVPGIVEWPKYSAGDAKNFVFRKDLSYIEPDTDRAEAVAYINTIVR
ncbi:hypothetical protein HYFRA_00010961, partial [Hymenoscyphus fraxineus]